MSHHGTSLGQTALNSYTFNAVAGTLTYTGFDIYGLPLAGLVAGRNLVFVGGIKLNEKSDYTVSADGTSITLSESIPTGEMINIIAMGLFSVANAITQAQADATYYRRRNRLLNSSFLVRQINGLNLVNLSSGNDAYIADGFIAGYSSSVAAVTAQVVNKVTPSGSPNRLRISVTTPDSGATASNYLYVKQHMEGLFTCDLQFGQAAGGGKTLLGRVGLNSPLAGTHTIFYTNAGLNRTYLGTLTIASGEVNTDVIKYVRFTPDISGTWASDTSRGVTMGICFAANSAVQGASSNAWIGTTSYGAVGQVNGLAAVNTFEVFDLALWDVTGMSTQSNPAYEVPDYGETLRTAQRYYEIQTGIVMTGYNASSGNFFGDYACAVKRLAPTLSAANITYSNASGLVTNNTTVNSYSLRATVGATSGAAATVADITINSLL